MPNKPSKSGLSFLTLKEKETLKGASIFKLHGTAPILWLLGDD